MKKLKYILVAMFLSTGFYAFGQTSPEVTNKIIAERNYIVVANFAMPMASADVGKALNSIAGGQNSGNISLSGSQYNLKVTKDSVVAYLPYYGRAYSAPINPGEGGIKFTSKDFSYEQSKSKKGVYTIQIKTNDVQNENYRLTLTVSEKGYASLTVNSINKQPITFSGVLDEQKAK